MRGRGVTGTECGNATNDSMRNMNVEDKAADLRLGELEHSDFY